MRTYRLSDDADNDLKAIARYTLQQWGEDQTIRYMHSLDQIFSTLTDRPPTARQFSLRFPQVLVIRCNRHYAFYVPPENEIPLIIAVLHERMNFIARLQDRLGE